MDLPNNDKEIKRVLNKCCNNVADVLGHTKQVSKSSYIYPVIIDSYMNNPIKFLNDKNDLLTILKSAKYTS